jgi:glycosyltransferase involved in cell wall biosynthesis
LTTETIRPLRVAVITETYPPEINGVANTMRHLVTGLTERGHQVRLVRPHQAADPGPGTSDPTGETLVPGLPIPGYRGLRLGLPVFWRLRRLWRNEPPDVAYIATQGPLGRAALNAAEALGVPTVTGFHTQFHQYSHHYGLGFLTGPIESSLRRFHNRSDTTLVPTAELREILMARGFARVEVFGRGVDTVLFSPDRRRADLRSAWGCGPTDPVLIYVGRLAAEKNIELVLASYAAARATHPGTRCVLVGDGPERRHLAQAHPEVIFTGAKVGLDLAEHYASADLFVFPSLTETFGNVVTEAMASGLAVVAFDDAAAHHYLRSGETGLILDRDDRAGFIRATQAAVADVQGLRRLGAEARRTTETLGWPGIIAGLEARLRAVIAARTAGGAHRHVAKAAR